MNEKMFWEADLPPFPFRAMLVSEPDNEYARANMRTGEIYTVHELAGSCYLVTTDKGDKTLVWRGRFETVR